MACCAVDGCMTPATRRGWCDTHYRRWLRHGGVDVVLPRLYDTQAAGERNGWWSGDLAGYAAVHKRLRNARGKATDHPCWDCGNPADQWAYDHGDPNERIDSRGLPYSFDIEEHYAPVCMACHINLDRKH